MAPARIVNPSGKIQIVNRTSNIRDARFAYALPCWQYQMSVNLARYWGVDYDLELVGKAQQPSPTALKLWLFDNSDMAGALGYHDVGADGQPYGRVFVLDDIKDGCEITVTVDHELLELAVDPTAQRVVGPDAQGRYFSVEICDPVEDDRDGVMISVGSSVVRCSNFVTPFYFGMTNHDGSTDFDLMCRLVDPVPALLDGGYQEYSDNTGRWHSLTARLAEDGTKSTRSQHQHGRSTMRAAMALSSMTIEPSSLTL